MGDEKAPPTYLNNDKVMTIGSLRYIVPFKARVIRTYPCFKNLTKLFKLIQKYRKIHKKKTLQTLVNNCKLY